MFLIAFTHYDREKKLADEIDRNFRLLVGNYFPTN